MKNLKLTFELLIVLFLHANSLSETDYQYCCDNMWASVLSVKILIFPKNVVCKYQYAINAHVVYIRIYIYIYMLLEGDKIFLPNPPYNFAILSLYEASPLV